MWHGNGRGHESQAQTPEAIPGWLSSVQTEQARKGHGEETWPSRVRQTAERGGGRAGFEQCHITYRRAGNGTKLAGKDCLQEQNLALLMCAIPGAPPDGRAEARPILLPAKLWRLGGSKSYCSGG